MRWCAVQALGKSVLTGVEEGEGGRSHVSLVGRIQEPEQLMNSELSKELGEVAPRYLVTFLRSNVMSWIRDTACVQILSLPHTSCVTFSRLHNTIVSVSSSAK